MPEPYIISSEPADRFARDRHRDGLYAARIARRAALACTVRESPDRGPVIGVRLEWQESEQKEQNYLVFLPLETVLQELDRQIAHHRKWMATLTEKLRLQRKKRAAETA